MLQQLRTYFPREELRRGQDPDLQPAVMRYVTQVALPRANARGQVNPRNEQELRVLAASIDALLEKDVLYVLDLLTQQFKAVELAEQEKSWSAAKHLNPLANMSATSLSGGERERLLREEQREAKTARLMDQFSGRGGGVAVR